MKKIIKFLDNFSYRNPGVSKAVLELSKLVEDKFVLTVYTNNFSEEFKNEFNGEVICFKFLNFWKYASQGCILCDLIHLHGVWVYPQYIGAKLAIKYDKPFILSPHGMLEPWLMELKNVGLLKYVKKKFYLKFVALPIFNKATYIHAITPLEKKNLSQYFPKEKIVVIPNAIDVENINHYIKYQPKNRLKKRILFVGRLHPIKGVEILIKAFLQGQFFKKGWELWIVGPEEVPEYVAMLKQLSKGFEKFIKFIGPIFDPKKKFELYTTSWITVVPSYSEVVGMVNLESAVCYTPTITTYETGLLDWEEGGNILIHPKVEDLLRALYEVTEWSFEERLKRGERAHNLVGLKYSKETVKKQWLDLYESAVRFE